MKLYVYLTLSIIQLLVHMNLFGADLDVDNRMPFKRISRAIQTGDSYWGPVQHEARKTINYYYRTDNSELIDSVSTIDYSIYCDPGGVIDEQLIRTCVHYQGTFSTDGRTRFYDYNLDNGTALKISRNNELHLLGITYTTTTGDTIGKNWVIDDNSLPLRYIISENGEFKYKWEYIFPNQEALVPQYLCYYTYNNSLGWMWERTFHFSSADPPLQNPVRLELLETSITPFFSTWMSLCIHPVFRFTSVDEQQLYYSPYNGSIFQVQFLGAEPEYRLRFDPQGNLTETYWELHDYQFEGYDEWATTSFEWSTIDVVQNEDPTIPVLTLPELKFRPNPFQYSVNVIHNFTGTGDVIAHIFNIRGQCVRRIICSSSVPIVWDGKDDRGIGLPKGIYLISCALGLNKQTGKILKL